MRKMLRMAIGVALAATPAAVMATATPALAQGTGSTPTSFTVETGALEISVPKAASLGLAPLGSSSISGTLGNVEVIDSRGSASGSWVTTVSSTAFVTGSGTGPETIPSSDVDYNPGSAVATTGVGKFSPGTSGDLAAPITAFSASAEVGNTTVIWDPTITVNLPTSVVSGTYLGTITHSVA
jgi:hypothetical protein